MLREVVEEPLQIRLVLDANIVQQELRWRLRARRNQEARSALHEVIDSGTIVPYGPTALAKEIDDHIVDIAEYAKVTEERAREEWAKFRSQIHFHEPDVTDVSGDHPDPDDVPYKQTCIELGADAVYTRDHHFEQMGVPLIRLDLDKLFRKYARATSIKLAFSVGSAFTVTISVGVLSELLKLSAKGIRRIPTPVKVAFLAAIATALIHPRSRAKIVEVGKNLWNKFKNPKFKALLSSLVVQVLEAHGDSAIAAKEIEAALPRPRKRSALGYARHVCLREKEPITLEAMEARIRQAGYVTRSKNFTAYLRRVLRANGAFIEVSPGIWALRRAIAHAG